MRAPSLLAQCLPGLVPNVKGSHSLTSISERDLHLPSPAVEILPSKRNVTALGRLMERAIDQALNELTASAFKCVAYGRRMTIECIGISLGGYPHKCDLWDPVVRKTAHPYKYAGENVDLQGLHVFKGRVSVADIIGFNGSEMICTKPDGYLKSWDSSIDLVNVLKHEIRDGQLSFRGKHLSGEEIACNAYLGGKRLHLGSSYGLPGIFACLKGACTVHFQDLNAETIRCTTIPNVLANLEQARERQSRQPESPLTPSRQTLAPSVHFYAGDWEELPTVLSVVRNDGFEVTTGMSQSFSEEDFMEGCSSQDGSIMGQESSLRRSRKLSGSRAWERASETDQGEGGYDIILMTEIPYSLTSLRKIYSLIKKCLRPPYGIAYLATKKNYVGFNSGTRHLRNLVDEEGIFGAHLVKEIGERDIWKFFLK
ncbi:hypothetical protein FEM48_Zijuj07G0003100 [Ziziphus jujuba var. spinosa]|uniref:Histidine protein methyltransferase 1 homolog n=1 Tax=Ziziphus jujuba var. spinosa TaxID=714518 RepID=A0A978V1C1_ZIZJJ|nr:hypothetical protein FEM48_Zijuj07G0003100 [Ziziphus jujuba var. spinosa]